MAFDGFVISNLVYELNNTILNAKISKIAQPETDEPVSYTHLTLPTKLEV